MASTTVNIHEAKTHLSKLIEKAERGEEVVIARAGKPTVKLVLIEPKATLPRIGAMKGQFTCEDIKTPFKDDIEAMFYGEAEGKFD
jgi:prevent-host-death family protein